MLATDLPTKPQVLLLGLHTGLRCSGGCLIPAHLGCAPVPVWVCAQVMQEGSGLLCTENFSFVCTSWLLEMLQQYMHLVHIFNAQVQGCILQYHCTPGSANDPEWSGKEVLEFHQQARVLFSVSNVSHQSKDEWSIECITRVLRNSGRVW